MSVSRINSPNPSTTPGMKERSSLIYREKERCEIPQLTRARGAALESTLLPLKAATIVLTSYCCCDLLPQTQCLKTQIYHDAVLEIGILTWVCQAKSKVSVELTGGSREECVSLTFPVSRGHLHSLALSPITLYLQSQQQQVESSNLIILISFSSSFLHLQSPCDDTGPMVIIQEKSSYCRII